MARFEELGAKLKIEEWLKFSGQQVIIEVLKEKV